MQSGKQTRMPLSSELQCPRLSVTVVTYNHGEWLRECLLSIVTQETTFPFEVIVGDDCSTDGITCEILCEFAASYPDLIVPVLRNKNVGATENYFDIVRRARGEYIAHIDGDDRILPGKLQKQVDFLDQHSSCSMVGHDLRIFDGVTGSTIAVHFTNLKIPQITDINFLVLNRTYFGHCSKMYRRNAILSLYRDMPTIDFFLHVEHATKGNIGYIDEILGEYRKSRETTTDRNGPFYQKIVSGYYDAFNRALELGVAPDVVVKGRFLFNYSIAYENLLSEDQPNFKKFISLDKNTYRYASWKHRFLYALSYSPRFALLTIKLKELCLIIIKKFL
jgi:glycosyltransferase involved in cell wall biosynthesis